MVEIPVQRKARRPMWPIVLLLLILAAIAAWYFWSRSATTTETNTTTPAPTSALVAPVQVAVHAPVFRVEA